MATPTLTTDIRFSLTAQYVDSADLNPNRGALPLTVEDALESGTTANKADLLWWDTRTLTSASEDLDLAGSLVDVFDNVLTFVKIIGIYIKNQSTTATESLAVGGAAANQFINWVGNSSDILNVGPDGILWVWSPVDGYAVTADSGDKLKIDSGSDTITYDIILIGRSA